MRPLPATERVSVQLWLDRPADTNLGAVLDAPRRALETAPGRNGSGARLQ